jgi:hypothetical protein
MAYYNVLYLCTFFHRCRLPVTALVYSDVISVVRSRFQSNPGCPGLPGRGNNTTTCLVIKVRFIMFLCFVNILQVHAQGTGASQSGASCIH